jgi:N-acetylglucosaminyldiphosphoundecaprenol N-acetyl-beta-D-mannosaminyltransferase
MGMTTALKSYEAIGTKITSGDFDSVARDLLGRLNSGNGGYVCFANAHTTVTARTDEDFASALGGAYLVLPDGRSIYWLGRLSGLSDIEQMPGPDFMWKLLNYEVDPPLRHYFYGGTTTTLDRLVKAVTDTCFNAHVVGFESPPFRTLSTEELDAAIRRINDTRPDFVWIGLGAPKQECWMAEFADRLAPAILLGVGAAFDFHAGTVPRAPKWMQFIGLEWVHRLMLEPRRLWRRYFITNSLFVVFYFLDLVHRIHIRR